MRRPLLLVTIPLAAGLSACGGGPSKAAFLSRADATCEPANAKLAAIGSPTDQPQVATAAGTFTTVLDGEIGQLRKHQAPGGEIKAQIEAVWGSMASLSQSTRTLQQAAASDDDRATAKAMNETSARYREGSPKATALGLRSCMVGMKSAMDKLADGTRSIIKTSYLDQGRSICDAFQRTVDALPAPPDTASPSTAGRYFKKAMPIFDKLVADLRSIPVPPGDEATVEEMLRAQEVSLAKFKEFSDALLAKDTARISALEQQMAELGTLSDAKFISYGLKACAE